MPNTDIKSTGFPRRQASIRKRLTKTETQSMKTKTLSAEMGWNGPRCKSRRRAIGHDIDEFVVSVRGHRNRCASPLRRWLLPDSNDRNGCGDWLKQRDDTVVRQRLGLIVVINRDDSAAVMALEAVDKPCPRWISRASSRSIS